jgi:hypothetical protein
VVQQQQRVLTKTEIAFIEGTRQFTKEQARCIRCRLKKKKLKTLNVELSSVSNFGSGVSDFCNAAGGWRPRVYETELCRLLSRHTEIENLLCESTKEEKSALVAQPAERRFRKPAICGADTLGRGFKSHLGLFVSLLSFSSTKRRSAG